MRLRSPSPSPRVCSPFDCASAISTVTSRSARGADLLRALGALGAELGGLALPLGLHALVDRLAVLLRQIGAPDAHVDDVDAVGLRLVVELLAHPRHQVLALSRTTCVNVASPSTRRNAELSRIDSCEVRAVDRCPRSDRTSAAP